MRKVALLGLLAAIVLTFGMTAGAQEASIGVAYTPMGPDGVLELVNADGKSFMAFNAFGALVMHAVAESPHYAVVCPYDGSDPDGVIMRVIIEETGVEYAVEDPDDWIWE